jgi:hypothetical protein
MEITHTATAEAPAYVDGVEEIDGDLHLRTRYYTYLSDAGLVAGAETNVMFTIDRPACDVWPFAVAWDAWQTKEFYNVEKLVPEYLIVVSQPVLTDEEVARYGLPGFGGVSAGYHVLMLNDFASRTTVSVFMDHASVMAKPRDAGAMSAEDALAPWQAAGMAPSWSHNWRDTFIPAWRTAAHDAR